MAEPRQGRSEKELLRFVTCGSVDDGKSTLIGRCSTIPACCTMTSSKPWRRIPAGTGRRGDALDFALLLDGLSAEREQGITIDVAWRYFATEAQLHRRRRAGHEHIPATWSPALQMRRRGLLVDARKGLQTQTRRHFFLFTCSASAHRLAVNKMDLVGHDQASSTRSPPSSGRSATGCPPTRRRRSRSRRQRRQYRPALRSDARYQGSALVEQLEQVPLDDGGRADGRCGCRCNGSPARRIFAAMQG